MTRIVRIVLAAGLVAALLSLAGCSDPQAEQRERLDDAIHDVERAISRFYTVDPEASIDELGTVTERLGTAWDRAREEAAGLDDIDIESAQRAFDDLATAADALPDDLPARDGLGALAPLIEAFDAAVDEIHDGLDAH